MLLNLSINLENDIYHIGLLSSAEIKYMKLHSTYRLSVHIDSYFFRQRWKGMDLGIALGKRSWCPWKPQQCLFSKKRVIDLRIGVADSVQEGNEGRCLSLGLTLSS